ncbi:MAG: YceI family protein [Bacteroidia bacterium]|nr:YceI family protein [Bacteroidia bacterium]
MKKSLKHFLVLLAVCVTGFSQILNAQSAYKISDSKENDMKLSGTSTIHDWVMEAKTFTGEAQFVLKPGTENQLISITDLAFSLVVTNLKSDKKKLDMNAYEALKATQHKNIFYTLISAKVSPGGENKYLITTEGNLNIAGFRKEVTMNVYGVVNKDGTITCTGTYKLKMTDYQVTPPSFMLGAMKAGDDLILDFTLVYKKQPGI